MSVSISLRLNTENEGFLSNLTKLKGFIANLTKYISTFLGVNDNFVTIRKTLSGFFYDLFLIIWTYEIFFSFAWKFIFLFRSGLAVKRKWQFYILNFSFDAQISGFFVYPAFFKRLKTVCWWMLSFLPGSYIIQGWD